MVASAGTMLVTKKTPPGRMVTDTAKNSPGIAAILASGIFQKFSSRHALAAGQHLKNFLAALFGREAVGIFRGTFGKILGRYRSRDP